MTGSGHGLGRAIALELATHGCHVVLNGRDGARVEQDHVVLGGGIARVILAPLRVELHTQKGRLLFGVPRDMREFVRARAGKDGEQKLFVIIGRWAQCDCTSARKGEAKTGASQKRSLHSLPGGSNTDSIVDMRALQLSYPKKTSATR